MPNRMGGFANQLWPTAKTNQQNSPLLRQTRLYKRLYQVCVSEPNLFFVKRLQSKRFTKNKL